MQSSGLKSVLREDFYTPPPRGTKQKTGQRKRPATATSSFKGARIPWSNPNAHPVVPTKKFHVTLNHTPFESTVSKKAPFASRPHSANPTVWDTPKIVNGKVYSMPPYNPLEDPHLANYYQRKLGTKPSLLDANKLKGKRNKPKNVRAVYNITVVTGDQKNANTNAQVLVHIRGTMGKLQKQPLIKKSEDTDSPFVFKRSSCEGFTLRSADFGDLISLEIEHNGVERNQSWYLERVIVKNQKTKKTWVLQCQSWLSLYDGDCQVKRILKPLANEQKPERVVYEVAVVTGDVRGAGTDAHVFLTMFGAQGSTRRVQLVNRNIDTFERSQTDVFKIKVKYLGKLQRLIVDHDNTGFSPGWFLERIEITNTTNDKEKWYFLCKKWLAKDEQDGEISRVLLGTKSLDNIPKVHKYTISTYTGNVRGAGTDANVYVTMFSTEGNSTEMKLNDSKNNFERNKSDTFYVECPDIGLLTRIRIRHDNKGLAAGWFLEKVVVKNMKNKVFEFPCSRWLSESEDDGEISRDLVLASTDGVDFTPGIPYNLHVTTGDERGAGTSAKVYIILYGGDDGEKNSGKLWVHNGLSNNFERGHTDIFHIECAEQLSPVHHATVGHDNSGMGAGWLLEKVVIESPTSGVSQTFFCRKWLADDEGDKLIERDLYEDMDYRVQRERKNVWNMAVYTTDVRGAGTDANVSFTLYGERGKTEETILDNKTNNFERGNVDKFKVDVKDIGCPYKIRIGHDNSKMYSDWHLAKIELTNSLTSERYLFECDRWIGTGEDDGQCVRELPAQGGSADPLPVILYEVFIYTGDKRGAGTDADVFVNVFGERGDTGNRPLLKSKRNRNKFERNQVDEFILEAVHLSKQTSIRIGHNGKNSGAGWYLNKVIIKDPLQNENFVYLCNRWLASDEDDGQIVRELPVGETATLLKTTSYHVGVKTGDIKGAGTNANVYMILFGEHGDTGKLQLRQSDNTKDKWERGRIDNFSLEAMDIGQIKKLVIGHDGNGLGAGWYLESVNIDVPSHGQHVRFSCNRWLAADEDDRLIERELYPSELMDISKKVPYEVEVHTGDMRGAGTNSNVFIVLYGREKKSEEFWLRNKTDNFERAEVDKFKIESDEIGVLMKIRVGHDNAGIGAAWFLDKIIVRRLKPPAKPPKKKKRTSSKIASDDESCDEDDCNYVFPCGRWLAKGEDDGQIIRELVPFNADGTRMRKDSLSAVEYTVHVHTGDVSGSGTNANVFLTIYGSTGDTGERELKKSETNFDKFERNQEDIFKINALSLGKLMKVKIRHDNSGLQSSWYLDRLIVNDTKKNAYLFPCERWLSKTEDDGSLCRELVAVDRANYERRKSRLVQRKQSMKQSQSIAGDTVELEQMAEQTTYNIKVVTGDVSGAGTDANVYVTLYGEKGDSGRVELKASKTNSNKFERNQTDEFTTEAVDLGALTKIRIGHDNKGGFAGWFLDKVTIDAPSMGQRWIFLAGRWLDKSKEDGKLEIDLYPSAEREEVYEKHVPYEIVVHTSDVSGAGTESNVFITLYGMGAICTEQIFLNDSKKKRKDCFNRGSVDVFVRELADVGEQIDKLRIGHDNKGFGAAWHLDKVEIRKLTDGDANKGSITFTFPCKRWLAKGEDDGAIVRELVPSKIIEEVVDKQGKVEVAEHRVDSMLDIHHYKVHVFTGDVKKAGTDANVFVTLYGENGDSGERQLNKSETHRDKFERNKEDIFLLEAADLGSIHKLVVRHDNTNLGSDWFLDRIRIVDTTDNDWTFDFLCERWLAKKRDDGKIKRTLYEKNYEGDRVSVRSSSTSVYGSTHHKSTASLDSRLTVGSSPSSRENLARSQNADSVFQEQVKGKLKKAPSKVSLGGASTLGSLLETITYTVTVETGVDTQHATEANAFIVFIGTDGVSAKIPLQLIDKERFEASSVEQFTVESENVGDLKKVEFGHDGYRPQDSWYVVQLKVDVPNTGRRYTLPCHCWLGKDKENGKTSRIFSVADDVQYKPKIPYQVSIYTGDLKNAGTDAQLKMTVFGLHGQSEEIALEKGEERFERNSLDFLRMDIQDVGALTKLRIGHDGKGSRPQWYLEKVVFLSLDNESVVVFNCGQWFSKSQGDAKTVREIPAQINGKVATEETEYTIRVITGDKRGCGTDANVFIVMFGEKGSSDELALKESSTNKDKFERAKTDVFTFKMLSLGRLSKVRIWHDNKLMCPGWFLASVEVIDNHSHVTYSFPCDRWLAKDEDDGSLIRELACVNKDTKAASKESLAVTRYDVTVVTSNQLEAGTVHNVMLRLVDVKGVKSDEILLENSPKKKLFGAGQTDTTSAVTRPLAALKHVFVGVQTRKSAKKSGDVKWHLNHVIIKDVEDDVSYLFPCDQWLKASQPIQLECSEVEKSKVVTIRESVPVQYEIKVYTADVKSAGTDANVFINLFGENGDTGKRELKKKFRDLFEKGQMDDFKIESLDLGKLTKLNIEHDNKGFGAGWMLDRVEVKNTKDNTVVTFPCQQWLDKKKGDKAIFRQLIPASS